MVAINNSNFRRQYFKFEVSLGCVLLRAPGGWGQRIFNSKPAWDTNVVLKKKEKRGCRAKTVRRWRWRLE